MQDKVMLEGRGSSTMYNVLVILKRSLEFKRDLCSVFALNALDFFDFSRSRS